ncbi:MAG: translocation/assembly module TamB domain-containing protein [Alphaproteobacteria bacterium]|nr:translocation/assembly module TamB domain-containing protein [Alphaproteobacteria bacterium]
MAGARHRRCRWALGIGLGLVGVLVAGLHTRWAQDRIALAVHDGVQGILGEGYTLDPVHLSFTLCGHVTLTDVAMRDPDGVVLIGVRRLDVRLDLWALLHATVRVASARGDGVRVDMTTDADGVLNLSRLFGGPSTEPVDPDAPGWGGLPFELVVDDIGLRDGMVSLWGPPPEEGDPSGFEAKVLRLDGARVRLPRKEPAVHADGVVLDGVLLAPGPAGLHLDGSAVWTGEGVIADALNLQVLGSRLGLDGHLRDLFEAGDAQLTVTADPLDLGTLDDVLHTGTHGRYAGSLSAAGTFGGLGLSGTLAGLPAGGDRPATRGTLTVEDGTVVCLPGYGVGDPDRCDPSPEPGPIAEDAPLRWTAGLVAQGLHLEDILPTIGGPLRLEGHLTAHGGGTSWPDEVRVDDGRWDGEELDVYGVRVRRFGADIGLHRGVLDLGDLDLAGVIGTVAGGGTLDLVEGDLDLRLHGALVPSMLADFGVDQVGGRGTWRGRVTGDVFADGVPIDVAAHLDMAPVTWDAPDGVRVGHAVADAQVAVRNGHVTVDGSLTGTDLEAYGASMATVSVPRLRVEVTPTDAGTATRVSGDATSPSASYGDLARFDAVAASFDVMVPAEGDLSVDVSASVGDHELFGLLGNNGTVVLHLQGDDLHVAPDLRWNDDPFLVSPDVHVDLGTMDVDIDRVVFQPTWRQRWTNPEPLHLRVVDGGLADARLSLASNFGQFTVAGDLGTARPLAGRVTVDGLDLDAFAELFPDQLSGLDGVVTLELTATGSPRTPDLDLQVDAHDLFVEDAFRWLDVSGTLGVHGDRATVDLSTAVSDRPLVTVTGTLPVVSDLSKPGLSSKGSADVDVTVAPGTTERMALLLPGTEVPDGELSAVLSVRGDLHDPDLDLQGVADVEVEGLPRRARAEIDLRRREGKLDTSVDLYDGYDPIVVADGTAATRVGEVVDWLLGTAPQPDFTELTLFADDLDVRGRLDGFPLGEWLDWAGFDADVQGTVDGAVAVSGSPDTPELRVDTTAGLVMAGHPGDLHLKVEPEEGGYDAVLSIVDGDTTWLDVHGHVPMVVDLRTDPKTWGTGAFDLEALGDGIPLDVLESIDPGLDVQDGKLVVKGSLKGTLLDPDPNATVELTGLRALYRPIGIQIRDGNLSARLEHDPNEDAVANVTLNSLSLTTRPIGASLDRLTSAGASAITAKGSVRLESWFPSDIAGEVSLRNAWLTATDNTELRASGDLSTQGTWPDVSLRGRLAVDQGRVVLDTSELTESRAMQVDPSIVIHRRSGAFVTHVDAGPTLLDDLHLDVDLDLGRNTRMLLKVPMLDTLGSLGANLTRADIDARLGGDLAVSMDGGDLSIVGDVDLLAGRVSVLRGKFDIAEGSRVTFLGEDYANPQLDVAGAMDLGVGELSLRLSGPAVAPSFDFRSDDFGSEAAVLVILLTGQAPEDLSAQQGQAAIEAVGDLLLNSVLGGANLGSVSVESDGTVRVGLPVYRTVYVETIFDPTPKLNENGITVDAEWSILPRLLLRASYGDRLIQGGLYYELRLTSVCDQLRDAYAAYGGDEAAITGRCTEIRAKLEAAKAKGPPPVDKPTVPDAAEREEAQPEVKVDGAE